jgi:hypothetical protein
VKSWVEEADDKPKAQYDLDSVLRNLVFSHLVYHGYTQTAITFVRDSNANLQTTKALSPNLIDQMTLRQQIISFIMSGDIDSALTHMHNSYSALLRDRFDVLFELKYQKFLEIYHAQPLVQAVKYGREELVILVEKDLSSVNLKRVLVHQRSNSKMPKKSSVSQMVTDDDEEEEEVDSEQETQEDEYEVAMQRDLQILREQQQRRIIEYDKYKARLQTLFSLLAYSDPKNSPMAHLLDLTNQRERVSEIVNQAILDFEATQSPLTRFSVPTLERILSQSETCLTALSENFTRQCGYSFISYQDFL